MYTHSSCSRNISDQSELPPWRHKVVLRISEVLWAWCFNVFMWGFYWNTREWELPQSGQWGPRWEWGGGVHWEGSVNTNEGPLPRRGQEAETTRSRDHSLPFVTPVLAPGSPWLLVWHSPWHEPKACLSSAHTVPVVLKAMRRAGLGQLPWVLGIWVGFCVSSHARWPNESQRTKSRGRKIHESQQNECKLCSYPRYAQEGHFHRQCS